MIPNNVTARRLGELCNSKVEYVVNIGQRAAV